MNVVSNFRRYCALYLVLAAIAFALSSPLRAEEDEDFRGDLADLVVNVTSTVARADNLRDPIQRLNAFKAALSEIGKVEAATRPLPDKPDHQVAWALDTMAQLRTNGLSKEPISLRAIASGIASLQMVSAPASTKVSIIADLDGLIAGLNQGFVQAEAAANVGLAYSAAGFRDRAWRMLQIALDDLKTVDDGRKASVARSAVILIFRSGAVQTPEFLVSALSMLQTSADRANTLFEEVNRNRDDLARDRRPQGLPTVWRSILTSGTGATRDRDLKAVASRLYEEGEVTSALVAALGIAAELDQSETLAALSRKLTDAGLALRALEVAGPILHAPTKVSALLYAAEGLVRSGYTGAAGDAASKILPLIQSEKELNTAPVLTRVASLMARGGIIGPAELIAGNLADVTQVSVIWAAVAQRLFELKEYGASEDAAKKIGDPQHRAPILALIVKRRLDAGDLSGAITFAASMPPSPSAIESTLNVIVAAALAGRLDAVESLISQRQGMERDIARYAVDLHRNPSLAVPQIITDNLLTLNLQQRDTIRRNIVAAQLAVGSSEAARRELPRVEDSAARIVAEDLILHHEATNGNLAATLLTIREVPDWRRRVALFRRIAVDLSLQNDRYKLVSVAFGRSAPLPHVTAGPSEFSPVERFRDEKLTFSQGEGELQLGDLTQWPKLATRASDIRSRVPIAGGGTGGLALARQNRFLEKFFEESLGVTAGSLLFESQKTVNPVFLQLTRGVFGISDLRRLLGNEADRYLPISGDTATIRLPIVVGPDATLVLSGAEIAKVHLSANHGGFLVNVGKLFVVDMELTGFDEEKNAPAHAHYSDKVKFRPFIVSWSDSEFYLASSRVVSLGYNAGKAYGLALSSGPKSIASVRDDEKAPLGVMVENSIENCLYGFYSYEANDAVLAGNEYRDNIVYGVDPHDRSKRLLIAFNTAYGSEEKHGIIVSREVNDGAIIGNVTFKNKGSGFMLDRSSTGNVIYANTAIANVQDGITLFESACNLLLSNYVVENERSGIKVRNSYDVGVVDNIVTRNAKNAVEGYIAKLEGAAGSALRDFELDPYQPLTNVIATGNVLDSNRSGISAKGVSSLGLGTNLLKRQTPRLFGGNLDEWRVRILSYVDEGSTTVVNSTCLPRRPVHACSLLSSGVFPSAMFDRFYSSNGSEDYCVSKPGSVQNLSFEPDADQTEDEE